MIQIQVLIGILVVSIIFFVLISMIIRELFAIFFKPQENTYGKSADISFILTLLMLLQYFVQESWALSISLTILMAVVLYVMILKLYKMKWQKSLLAFLTLIVAFFIIMLLFAFVLLA